jgi:glycerate kinase
VTPGRVLVCPDKFRGTLTAPEAARAISAGLRAAGFDDIVELPLADGGEGTLDALLAGGGEMFEARVTGPDGEPASARWGLLPDGTAVIEMAQASGLALVHGPNDPLTATTFGTGELIAIAAARGATSAIVGVGGSATVDGGLGALSALGWRLPLPVVVACDVATGYLDAAWIFGPQKGADPAAVEALSDRLKRFAVELLARTGVDVRTLTGSGAAGGLAGGLAALGATLRPGFAVVAEAVGFEEQLRVATLVVTGEGRLDETSLSGKVVGEVVRLATENGTAARVVAGDIAPGVATALPGQAEAVSLVALAGSPEQARSRAAELVTQAARQIAERLR